MIEKSTVPVSLQLMPDISVVVCAYTEERWHNLAAAVESLKQQSFPAREIIVVVDHNRALAELARRLFDGVVLVESNKPRGLSGARNCGIEAARGEVIAFLDDDALADRDWLERLVSHYEDPRILGVGGKIEPMYLEGRPFWFPEEFDWVVGCSYRGLPENLAPVRNMIGCNMSFRREVLELCGGFRIEVGRIGKNSAGREDDETEFCIRCSQRIKGGIILYEPQARVRHCVPPERASWRYLLQRCWSEGLSKARLTQLVGRKDGLASEWRYSLVTLPRGVARSVSDTLVKRDPGGLGRAFAIIAGFVVTSSGYLIARIGGNLDFLRVGLRHSSNLVVMAAKQQGYLAAATVGARFLITEVAKLPKIIQLTLQRRNQAFKANQRPRSYSSEILKQLAALNVEMKDYCVSAGEFLDHISTCRYPKIYAGGSVHDGGVREKKLLEYFVSLKLLDTQPTDVVIDVASEWSIFPEVLGELTGATVYRQDLIYPPGINGDRIGGSAASMPVTDCFADKLVLHNSFEHFEGNTDTDFIKEAWRVLKPGGALCILPLYLASDYYIRTDPLVNRRGVVWDEGARVFEIPWWHNRFGRFYDAKSLEGRVLIPAIRSGFKPIIYHIANIKEVLPQSDLHFVLFIKKPVQP